MILTFFMFSQIVPLWIDYLFRLLQLSEKAWKWITRKIYIFRYCDENDPVLPEVDPESCCSWDILTVLSLLKFLQMPLFFEYLVSHLRHCNRSNYFIKTAQVREFQTQTIFRTIFNFAELVDAGFRLPLARMS